MRIVLAAVILSSALAAAQSPQPFPDEDSGPNQLPPRSDQAPRESSSRDTRIDVTPPKNDNKAHPDSSIDDEPIQPGDTSELHPFNPLRALRDDDVGEYYFKLKNYRAALARYQDALAWKERDAIATFGIAKSYEKLEDPEQAAKYYQEYLKILPNGPLSKDAHKALQKLKDDGNVASQTSAKQ